MSLPIVLRRAARAEFDDASEWYESRRAGLGAAFTAAVERIFDRIADRPDYYPEIWRDVREALVAGYPYCVYYCQEPSQVVVLSVFHTSRNPATWQGRS